LAALETYLQAYIRCLPSAGLQALHSLPSYGNIPQRPILNFSEVADVRPDSSEHWGLPIDKWNVCFIDAWAKAKEHSKDFPNPATASIAWYQQQVFLDDRRPIHVQMELGSPKMIGVCPKEIIVQFIIPMVRFYDTGDFDR
jgi:hypothetical protein